MLLADLMGLVDLEHQLLLVDLLGLADLAGLLDLVALASHLKNIKHKARLKIHLFQKQYNLFHLLDRFLF